MRLILGRHGMAAHNVAFENYEDGNRHAFRALPDQEVPLVAVSARQAWAVGDFLRSQNIAPEPVFVSPTLRARQTWE